MEAVQDAPMGTTGRIDFLVQRADAQSHNSHVADSVRHACRGTLLRDAASIALMLERYEQATSLLRAAGDAWAGIGLFAGYLLLHFTDGPAWVSRYEGDLLQIAGLFEWRYSKTTAPSPRAKGRGYLAAASWSPRQLLNLYQALPDDPRAGEPIQFVRHYARTSLDDLAATTLIGDLRVADYLLVWDAAAQGNFDGPAQDALVALLEERARRLQAAQADTHHWYRGIHPAGLVDFDLMALGVKAIESRAADKLDHILHHAPPLVALPWTAAQRLRSMVNL
ncbi:hypothetical protein ISN76_06650 [Dyella halodurans]|uniref:Uncharacterized protein n=1 Tax=Dyella halodurans TaxID=1920171 RepID=A0ABV9C418_9GAMM|nr:hypothetical protein [Dyella halodurans]